MKKAAFVLIIITGVLFLIKPPVTSQVNHENYLDKSAISAELYKEIHKYFDFDEAESEKNYPEGYAGSYIDDNGNLVLCYTTEEMKTILEEVVREKNNYVYKVLPEVIYEKKVYNYNQLLTAQEEISENMEEFGYHSVRVQTKANKIIASTTESRKTRNYSLQNGLLEVVQEDKSEYKESYDAYGGTKTYYKYLLNLFNCNGTIGFHAKDNDTGRLGIVTAAHLAEAGKVMKNVDGKDIGKATKRVQELYTDSAFIPFQNTSSVTWQSSYYFRNGNDFYSMDDVATDNIIVEGLPTSKIGITTGYQQGKILSKSAVVQIEGTYFIALIKISNVSKPGDSGGPVWTRVFKNGIIMENYILGIVSSANDEDTLVAKACNLLVIHNLTAIVSKNYESVQPPLIHL